MANTTDNTVSASQGFAHIVYSGSIDLTGALEDTHKTQWMLIGEADKAINAGYFSTASGSAGTNGDIQVTAEYSNDKDGTNYVSGGTLVADHDAASASDSKNALLGDTNYEEYKSYKYVRLSVDGQASNDFDTYEFSVFVPKNQGVALRENASLIGADVANEV